MPEVKRTDPAYLQVSNDIRQKIQEGELREDDKIPSVRQLAAEWGIARGTAEKALSELQQEGLVESRPGIGTVVAPPPTKRAMSSADWVRNVRYSGKIYPDGQQSHKIVAELTRATEEIAKALRISIDEDVVRRHRVTFYQDEVVSTSTSYLPGRFASTAPELLEEKHLPGGTIGCVENQIGMSVAEIVEERAACAATPHAASELGVIEGAPVLAGRNWYRASDGLVLEYGESFEPEGRWVRIRSTREIIPSAARRG